MGKKLRSQPLVEALCEFQFEGTGGNELTLPGLFYAEVRNDFPVQASLKEVSFYVEINKDEAMQPVIASQRLQLKRKDGSAMIQIGQNRLIVNQLQPYESWEQFRTMISEAFTKYTDLCRVFSLKSISLRYINHIRPETEGFRIDDFLTILPFFPKPMDKPFGSFQQTYELLYESPRSALVHQTGIVENSEAETLLVLDINLISIGSPALDDRTESTDQWLKLWLDQAHEHIENAFIASLNPSYYQYLKGDS